MKEKISALAELIKLARIDKKEHDEEYGFMLAIAVKLGVDTKTFDLIFSQNVDFVPPHFEFRRIVLFQEHVLLANVDGHLDEREIEMLKKIGLKLGLFPDCVDQVLTTMKNYDRGAIPPKQLIEIFQIHHN